MMSACRFILLLALLLQLFEIFQEKKVTALQKPITQGVRYSTKYTLLCSLTKSDKVQSSSKDSDCPQDRQKKSKKMEHPPLTRVFKEKYYRQKPVVHRHADTKQQSSRGRFGWLTRDRVIEERTFWSRTTCTGGPAPEDLLWDSRQATCNVSVPWILYL